MQNDNIGIDAGVIWNLLSEKKGLTIRQIGEYTGFNGSFISLPLGWLARENNIDFMERNGVVHIQLKKMTEMYY